jgi:hypothetical protein
MYGVYLIPPTSIGIQLSSAHSVLEREFGAAAAGRFMVHVTVKGFIRLKSGAELVQLIRELDAVYAGFTAFRVSLQSPGVFGSDRGTSVLVGLEPSESLWALHQATWRVIEPYLADDCPFTPGEQPGRIYNPHLSLVQYDLPSDPIVQEQALDIYREFCASLPSQTWYARDLQFIRFASRDWLGRWWDTLRYEQLHGWRLTGVPAGA